MSISKVHSKHLHDNQSFYDTIDSRGLLPFSTFNLPQPLLTNHLSYVDVRSWLCRTFPQVICILDESSSIYQTFTHIPITSIVSISVSRLIRLICNDILLPYRLNHVGIIPHAKRLHLLPVWNENCDHWFCSSHKVMIIFTCLPSCMITLSDSYYFTLLLIRYFSSLSMIPIKS